MILLVLETSLWRHRQRELAPANRESMFNPRDSPPITGNEKKLELNVYKGETLLLLISDKDEAVCDWLRLTGQ